MSAAISYSNDFNGKEYVKSFYSDVDGHPKEKGFTLLYRTQIIEFYKKYSSKWDANVARLLEFSGGPSQGPSIAGLISAAPYVNQIIFSAHTESERKEVEMWKLEEDGAHDWRNHFKFAVNKLEKIPGDAAWQDREKLLRQRITAIIGCDIFQDYPLSIKQDPFELISTSLCLEVACSTYVEYKAAVKKLVALLKPGGFLTMFIVERQTFYTVMDKRWPCLPVTLEQVKEALVDAGMVVLIAERDPTPIHDFENPMISDYKAVLFVAAQRIVF